MAELVKVIGDFIASLGVRFLRPGDPDHDRWLPFVERRADPHEFPPPASPPVLHPDAGNGGDWIKAGAWDIWWNGRLVDNVADMRECLDGMQTTVEEFKQLVVYKAHLGKPGFEWLAEL